MKREGKGKRSEACGSGRKGGRSGFGSKGSGRSGEVEKGTGNTRPGPRPRPRLAAFMSGSGPSPSGRSRRLSPPPGGGPQPSRRQQSTDLCGSTTTDRGRPSYQAQVLAVTDGKLGAIFPCLFRRNQSIGLPLRTATDPVRRGGE